MKHKEAKEYLGCQLWVEPTDSPERVDSLVKEAAERGLGWLRIFLTVALDRGSARQMGFHSVRSGI